MIPLLPKILGYETTTQEFRCGPFTRSIEWVCAVFVSLDDPTAGPVRSERVDLARFARPHGVWLDNREERA